MNGTVDPKYDPLFAKWTGSGEHFAFANQPAAGLANFAVLASSVAPLLRDGDEEANALVAEARLYFDEAVSDVRRAKLGFSEDYDAETASDMYEETLEPLMAESEVDYIVLFRNLSGVVKLSDEDVSEDAKVMAPTSDAFYAAPDEEQAKRWRAFLSAWRSAVLADAESNGGVDGVVERLCAANPKYVLREWMLVEAYDAAKRSNDFGVAQARSMYLTLVPIRPRPRGERRSLSTFAVRRFSLPTPRFQRPTAMPFNSASDAYELHPDIRRFERWNDPLSSGPLRRDAASVRRGHGRALEAVVSSRAGRGARGWRDRVHVLILVETAASAATVDEGRKEYGGIRGIP